MLTPYLQKLIAHEDLTESEAHELFDELVTGENSDVQVSAVLTAITTKGPTTDELVGFVQGLRAHAEPFPVQIEGLVDTCGTGGGAPSFNISTGAAIVAAAAGAKIGKHGNRAVSSKCGSADVLEALGANVDLNAAQAYKVFETTGMMFLFAPILHPAMKRVGPVRRALGVRTIFNWLGPMANPANASTQLIGVYDAHLIDIMASAMSRLGTRRMMIVNAKDGLDEVSPVAPTLVQIREEGSSTLRLLQPTEFGIEPGMECDLAPGETIAESASILKSALDGSQPCRSRALIPSSAAAIYLAGVAASFPEAAALARSAIDSGAAIQKLNDLVEATRSA